jgi:hypothetical protein
MVARTGIELFFVLRLTVLVLQDFGPAILFAYSQTRF